LVSTKEFWNALSPILPPDRGFALLLAVHHEGSSQRHRSHGRIQQIPLFLRLRAFTVHVLELVKLFNGARVFLMGTHS